MMTMAAVSDEGAVVTVIREYGVGGREDTHSSEEEERVCDFNKTAPILKYEMSKLSMMYVLCQKVCVYLSFMIVYFWYIEGSQQEQT